MKFIGLMKFLSKDQMAILETIANGEKAAFFTQGCGTTNGNTLNPNYWVKTLFVQVAPGYDYLNTELPDFNGVTVIIDSNNVKEGDWGLYDKALDHLYSGIHAHLLADAGLIDKHNNVKLVELKNFLSFAKEVNGMIEKYKGSSFNMAIRRIAAEGNDVDLFMQVCSAFKRELGLRY